MRILHCTNKAVDGEGNPICGIFIGQLEATVRLKFPLRALGDGSFKVMLDRFKITDIGPVSFQQMVNPRCGRCNEPLELVERDTCPHTDEGGSRYLKRIDKLHKQCQVCGYKEEGREVVVFDSDRAAAAMAGSGRAGR